MAEAHSAVAFGFVISHDEVNLSYDRELVQILVRSFVRYYKRRVAKFKNNFRTGIYPVSPGSLLLTVILVFGLNYCGFDLSFGLIRILHSFVPSNEKVSYLIAGSVYGVLLWLLLVQSLRLSIKLVLSYRGWLYEKHGQTSWQTKLFMMFVNCCLHHEPMLHSFQGALPRLPLPPLSETLRRHLKSMRPLLDDEKYERMVKLSNEFERTIGPRLQRYLQFKALFASNYVSDWWEEYVYLRGRAPIVVNSNYYGMDYMGDPPTHIRAARAANICYAALMFRRLIERQELKPITVNGVPLCSGQYERTFNTTRIPGIEADTLRHLEDSRHIVVFFRGCWFRVTIHNGRRLVTPGELEIMFQKILDSDCRADLDEVHIAALTGANRKFWAETRLMLLADPVNRTSLTTIESAAFVLCFDYEDYGYDPNDYTELDKWGRAMLHGQGFDRWFDKSFNIVIGKNCKVGFNAEHSWADAPISCHMFEYCLLTDAVTLRYSIDGHAIGEASKVPLYPYRLQWNLTPVIRDRINLSLHSVEALIQEVDLKVLMYKEYGKGFIKKCRVSPDGYLQMALQLVYYRDQGKFCLTYESSMTRLFRDGRTETIRSVSAESCEFVQAMDDANVSKEEKRQLLKAACEAHRLTCVDAMCGKGVDRHLFCLYVVDRYLELDSPFLKEVLSEPWLLSTSQTPQNQSRLVDYTFSPHFITYGGGFGPVADGGYGVSYIIVGENVVNFHISSKSSCGKTSSTRFREGIIKSLTDMKALFDHK